MFQTPTNDSCKPIVAIIRRPCKQKTMAKIIDNEELDETNVEFNYASDFVKHTDRLVYLTGKAGTGKTTFLKYLRETTTKNTVILAPTGVAAINEGGQTIHSFFGFKPDITIEKARDLARKVKPKKLCPHCDQLIAVNGYARWHGDNCKSLRK